MNQPDHKFKNIELILKKKHKFSYNLHLLVFANIN